MIRLRDYLNAHKALRFVDRADLYDAGLKLSDLAWGQFAHNPTKWLIEASDADAEKAWAASVKKAQP